MYKAVVFDMDGVLIDSEKIYRMCWKKNGMSIGIPEDEMEVICDRVAGGNKKSNGRVFKEVMGEDFDYLAFREKTMEMFAEYADEHGLELKPGVKETLEFLREHGVKIALATSTVREPAEERLARVGIQDYFDAKVCGDEITEGKPAPDIYLNACRKLGVEPEMAVGVEDSINGVISAHTAGLYTVMVVDLIQPNDITAQNADEVYYNMKDMCTLWK